MVYLDIPSCALSVELGDECRAWLWIG